MHETKIFEILDHCTCLPVVAIRVQGGPDRIGRLAKRVGYGDSVLLTPLSGGRMAHADAYAHGGRTIVAAHAFIEENWPDLADGAVIDVRVVLGETLTPGESNV